MEITGTIIEVLPIQTGTSAKGEWSSQYYILETKDQYPKKICVNVFGDNIDKFGLNINDSITASVNIESREYNGRWFTSVKAWKVEKHTDQPTPTSQGNNLPY